MEIDSLLKLLQDWTNKIPLIILGSGASVPFGLPSMLTLGEYIKNNISFLEAEDIKQFNDFKSVFDKNNDLEKTLFELQLRPNVLKEIVLKTWELVNKHDLEAYELLVCKKIDFPLADLSKYFLLTTDRKVSIITTNYDRLAEYAVSLADAFICNGYSQNYIGHFSSTILRNKLNSLQGFKGQANIWKVHGSLDWFKTNEELNIQLPLRHTIPSNCTPSIVTPGLNKYYETHTEPYRTIFAQADNEIENAIGYLCIGYGFNDIHVQPKLITQIKNNKPIIVITKELTNQAKQSIVGNNCKNYILIEQYKNNNDIKIFSSSFGEAIVKGVSYWKLC